MAGSQVAFFCRFEYNPWLAASRMFKLKTIKYEDCQTVRFDFAQFRQNAHRVKQIKLSIDRHMEALR